MEFRSATARTLDREHRDNLALLRQLESQVTGVPSGALPPPAFGRLAGAAAERVRDDIERHFRFEEEHLFARLEGGGEHDLVAALRAEHDELRTHGGVLLPALRACAEAPPDAAAFAALRPAALAYVQRMAEHIEHETQALLPTLDLVLDDDVDQEIAFGYDGQA